MACTSFIDSPRFSVQNKLVLITGAARGIGYAIARMFAEHGAHLVLVDLAESEIEQVARDLQEEFKSLSIRVSAHKCDVTSSSDIERLFDVEVKASHEGRLVNVVVNNAGIGKRIHFIDMSERDYEMRLNVHMKGPFLIAQAAAKRLVANYDQMKFASDTESYASIINIASLMANRPIDCLTHYASTKAGLDGLSRAMSRDLGKYRIRCNSVLPYFIETPMTNYIQGQFREDIIRKTDLGRFGKPEEVASLVLFLASDASSYITGSSFEIGGGA